MYIRMIVLLTRKNARMSPPLGWKRSTYRSVPTVSSSLRLLNDVGAHDKDNYVGRVHDELRKQDAPVSMLPFGDEAFLSHWHGTFITSRMSDAICHVSAFPPP